MSDVSSIEKQYSPDLLQAVGLLFVTASTSEQALAMQMARLICHPHKLDPVTMLTIQRAELAVRCRQIQTLALFRLPEVQRKQAIKICDDIKSAFQRRNEFAHFMALIPISPDKIILHPFMLESSKLAKQKPYTTKQIKSFAEKIFGLTRQLDEVLTAAGIRKISKSDLQATQEQSN